MAIDVKIIVTFEGYLLGGNLLVDWKYPVS